MIYHLCLGLYVYYDIHNLPMMILHVYMQTHFRYHNLISKYDFSGISFNLNTSLLFEFDLFYPNYKYVLFVYQTNLNWCFLLGRQT